MSGDDDLIFTDTAEEATRDDVRRPSERRSKPNSGGQRKPPASDQALRPHVLTSPVLQEPLMLSREKVYLIGRDENADIRIKTEKVSRNHAEIEWNGQCFVVRDLGSTNGSLLNNRPLTKSRVPLHDNDCLSFGGYEVNLDVLAPGEFPDLELGGRTKRMKLPPKGV